MQRRGEFRVRAHRKNPPCQGRNPDRNVTMPTNPPPDQSTVSPYLVANGAAELAEFIKTVFDAEEKLLMPGPNGTVMHGELRIGESVIMFADACEHAKPRSAMLHVYVPDVDAAYQRALDAGAKSDREPADQFYGDRSAGVIDKFGNSWYMATHVEDVPPEELARRQKEMMQDKG